MSEPTTHRVWAVEALLCTSNSTAFARRVGDRTMALAAGLCLGDQLTLRLVSGGDGTVSVTVASVSANPELDDLVKWVWEDVALLVESVEPPLTSTPSKLTEVAPARFDRRSTVWDQLDVEGAGAQVSSIWPVAGEPTGLSLLQALRSTRAEVRLHVAPINETAMDMVAFELGATFAGHDPLVRSTYLGTPVAARLLVGHDGPLSPRLRAALIGRAAGLRLSSSSLADPETQRAWDGQPSALSAAALPFGAARCLSVAPAAESKAELCGVPIITPSTRPVPIADEACRTGLRLGTASSTSGLVREVRLSPDEMLLHAQVVGSTGSGKSSLLAGLVRSAMDAGIGVSVLDPHGQLVDRLIAETPEAQAHRVTAVRSGDAELPIPLNPMGGRDPSLAVDTMTSVLRELHDPRNQGFMGPVWERWIAVLLSVQRELIGTKANLALLPELVADQGRLRHLAERLRDQNPDLSRDLRSLVTRRPEEFAETTTWISSKFQRMLGPVMRGILGSGRDAVDVVEVMDDSGALFLDLAAPEVGDLGAQLLGEMWLTKHWEALARRRDKTVPHLLIVDEAHLFASGLLPRLLTQSRKYGVGVVVAHQNLEQLTPSLREAVLSSTNNVFVFRTGVREALSAEDRLGNWGGSSLTRLDRLTAAVSLNSGSGLTHPFTLRVDHNEHTATSDVVADEITKRSRGRLGLREPEAHRLSWASLEKGMRLKGTPMGAARSGNSMLDDWLKRRAERADADERALDPSGPSVTRQ